MSGGLHWQKVCSGKTSFTSSAALSAMRRAPQLGHKPRRLRLNATDEVRLLNVNGIGASNGKGVERKLVYCP
jgi:hypothetical protein